MLHLVVSNSGPHQLPDIGRSFGGSDASRVYVSVGCNVVDLTAGDADVRKLAVRQATQLGTQLFAFAPRLKCIPICFERTVDLPLCACRSQLGGPIDGAHCGMPCLDGFARPSCRKILQRA